MTKTHTVIYVIFALLFILLEALSPSAWAVVVKVVPALLLASFFFSRQHKLMALAFCFCALGDALLHLNRQEWFIFGLLSFLLAHLLYTWLFWRERNFTRNGLAMAQLPIFVSLFLSMKLYPSLGALTVPVMIYIVAITCMGVATALAGVKPGLGFLGAMIFISSDATIAWDKFLTPVPASGFIIMVTYYLGNYLIADGYYRLKDARAIA